MKKSVYVIVQKKSSFDEVGVRITFIAIYINDWPLVDDAL